MKSHFLKNVEFANFKCFEKIEVKGLKNVNLVGGKNNIGKTSFLEGLEILVNPKSALGLRIKCVDILRRRQTKKSMNLFQPIIYQALKFDFFASSDKIIKFTSNVASANIKYIPINEKIEASNIHAVNPQQIQDVYTSKIASIPFMEFTLGDEKFASPMQDVENNFFNADEANVKNNVVFISSCTTDESALATYYGYLLSLDKEDDLNAHLNNFDTDILSLKAIPVNIQGNYTSELKLKLKSRNTLVKLSSLGEGINRYIAILCAIWASKDGYLFIDEIENGIHYTNYKKLWRIIFEASKMANCQVFATSHSKECIEAFNEVNTDNKGIYIEFYKNQKTGLITVNERDNEQLNYALTHGGSVRGE